MPAVKTSMNDHTHMAGHIITPKSEKRQTDFASTIYAVWEFAYYGSYLTILL